MSKQFDPTDHKFATWIKYLEDHKDDYPNEDEKVRRAKLSIDYQLTKFYNRFEHITIINLLSDDNWKSYVAKYYYHASLSDTFPQQRLLMLAKAYHTLNKTTFTAKFKQDELLDELAAFLHKK